MICVDASLVVKAVTDEEGCDQARALFESWAKAGESLVAPALLDYEVASALCRKAHLKDIRENEAIEAYRLSTALGVVAGHDAALVEQALLVARSFGQKTPYDFSYLAFAEKIKCDLYTADLKFVELVQAGYSFVKYFKS